MFDKIKIQDNAFVKYNAFTILPAGLLYFDRIEVHGIGNFAQAQLIMYSIHFLRFFRFSFTRKI